MNNQDFLTRILKIKLEVEALNEVSAMIVQNCDHAEESPAAASLAKVDLLSASAELMTVCRNIGNLAHSLQEYEPE
ncbi:MAG: hypothetical protein K6D37_05870 [Prevotella sp.]|nr:hypothetical protein [Prevotella sp.]